MRSRMKTTKKFLCVLKRAVGGTVGRGQMAVGWSMNRMLGGGIKD